MDVVPANAERVRTGGKARRVEDERAVDALGGDEFVTSEKEAVGMEQQRTAVDGPGIAAGDRACDVGTGDGHAAHRGFGEGDVVFHPATAAFGNGVGSLSVPASQRVGEVSPVERGDRDSGAVELGGERIGKRQLDLFEVGDGVGIGVANRPCLSSSLAKSKSED